MSIVSGPRTAQAPLGAACFSIQLPVHGKVSLAERLVSFVRPELTEEYSVSVDGVRQDFIIAQRPPAGTAPRLTEDNEGNEALREAGLAGVWAGDTQRTMTPLQKPSFPSVSPDAPETSRLRVELALSGARAEPAAYGARLTLDGSGRALAYSRLRAVDARGKDLPATMEVEDEHRLAIVVDTGKRFTRPY